MPPSKSTTAESGTAESGTAVRPDPTAAQPAARRQRLSPRARLLIVGTIAIAAIAGFLFADTNGYFDFVVPLRVKRLVALVVVGWAIGVSTVLFQTVTSNRILTPSLMGFDSVYVLLQTVVVFFFSSQMLRETDVRIRFVIETLVMIAFALTLFRWLFTRGRYELHVMILVGIVLGTLFRGLTSFLQRIIDPSEFEVLQNLLFASFVTVNEDLVWITLGIVALVTVIVLRRIRVYDVLSLGPATAISLGVNHRKEVVRVLTLVAILVSASTALVGPITFFGLLVAHLAYQFAGSHRHIHTLPMAALLAVITLVGGQFLLERVLDVMTTLSVIIEFAGGITFIALIILRARRNLV